MRHKNAGVGLREIYLKVAEILKSSLSTGTIMRMQASDSWTRTTHMPLSRQFEPDQEPWCG